MKICCKGIAPGVWFVVGCVIVSYLGRDSIIDVRLLKESRHFEVHKLCDSGIRGEARSGTKQQKATDHMFPSV